MDRQTDGRNDKRSTVTHAVHECRGGANEVCFHEVYAWVTTSEHALALRLRFGQSIYIKHVKLHSHVKSRKMLKVLSYVVKLVG